MKATKKAYIPLKAALGILVAAALILIADFILAYLRIEIRVRYFIPLSIVICAVFAYSAVKLPGLSKAVLIALAFLFGFTLVFILSWWIFSISSDYKLPDPDDKKQLFSDKNIMLIVPHEDDDLNLLGDVIEEYVSYGSIVKVVFSTNGDFFGRQSGQQRINEAIKVLTDLGVPESDIIFLGYSDRMSSDEGYFYDLKEPDAQVYSYDKKISSTYGIDSHSAYNEGNSFSREHLTQDLKACVLEYKPDTIFCVDRDSNLDHAALSLIFDQVMGEILSQQSDYRPTVLKGFAYGTAFFAKPDFYDSVNILSAKNPSNGEYMNEDHVYPWADRLRLPVCAKSLSRSMLGCRMWGSSLSYASQEMFRYTIRVINGDKVFWLRDTSSLTYTSKFDTSSGNSAVLSDFILTDRQVGKNSASDPSRVWIPSAEDLEPWIDIRFAAPSDVSSLKLYDVPSPEDNILGVTVTFDNGNEYTAGPLEPYGQATEIPVNEHNVSSLRIVIDKREGSAPGLIEAEVYAEKQKESISFIKLTDAQGNFIYDYISNKEGLENLSLYAYGAPTELSDENYSVECSNTRCSACIENGRIKLACPPGQRTLVKVQRTDGSLSDSVYIHNPHISLTDFWMRVEEKGFDGACGMYVRPISVKILNFVLGNSREIPA